VVFKTTALRSARATCARDSVRFVEDARATLERTMPADPRLKTLTTIPNVGPAIARRLLRLGIEAPGDLRGRDPEELFQRICALDGRQEDPCLLDTFTAAVAYADGEAARPWWHYSRERLAGSRAAR
jgi:hypothetical protein